MAHTFNSDTKRLIQFAKDQGWDCAYVMQAVERLEYAIGIGLDDYSTPEKEDEPEYSE